METPLVGDEPVEVLGATPEGALRFRLPRYAPVFHSTVRGGTFAHETHMDTLLIDADERRVELVWRVSVRLPRKSEHLEEDHRIRFGGAPGARRGEPRRGDPRDAPGGGGAR